MEKEVKYSPMINQYLEIKAKHKDTLILFRLGDFYELFFEDAVTASKVLQLTLTSKSAGNNQKVPMCGVPFHAISAYIDKLIEQGYKVGIVEQLEDPALAKGVVERDVIQIITPGANIDFKNKDNNYIAALDEGKNSYVFSYGDVSTGELYVENIEKKISEVSNEINNLNIKEVVVSTHFSSSDILYLREKNNVLISYENQDVVSIEHEYILNNVYDLDQRKALVRLLSYLKATQKNSLDYLKQAKVIKSNQAMQIDAFTRNNLELIRTIRSESTYGTLFWLIDKTMTNMGSRLLKKWVMKPLTDKEEILFREDVIEELLNNFLIRDDLKKTLDEIYDIERLTAKINYGSCNGKDLLALKNSLVVVPKLIYQIKQLNQEKLMSFKGMDYDFVEVVDLLERAIREDCEITIREGGIFKKGFNEQLDNLIDLSEGGKNFIASLEAEEKEKTGIKTLRIGYNKVFGYYIEISKGQTSLVKEEFGYERKQTTINSERFITKELKAHEEEILTAEDKRKSLEFELFNKLREQLTEYTERLQNLSELVSYIDSLVALSEVALENNYVRPTFNDERIVDIKDSRHPVVEKVMGRQNFVPNDFYLDKNTDILMITGPNMGGKSTYMRQLCLIVILAQIGSFVPSTSANLMIFSSIYTRIGASDDLVSGLSTFMVEMTETNFSLRHADVDSLLVFDEIGRGTATFDGMALAQAIIEYIASNIRCKTLFSTHYHEITKISEKLPQVKNIHVALKEEKDVITFLYKVQDGPMSKSYGVNVAKLADLPNELISRANEILDELEERQIDTSSNVVNVERAKLPSWVESVKQVDPLNMSPLDALNYLYDLKKKMKED